jgi:hypothetical protein
MSVGTPLRSESDKDTRPRFLNLLVGLDHKHTYNHTV